MPKMLNNEGLLDLSHFLRSACEGAVKSLMFLTEFFLWRNTVSSNFIFPYKVFNKPGI